MGKIKSDGGHSSYYDIPLGKTQLDDIANHDWVNLEHILKITFGGSQMHIDITNHLIHKANHGSNRGKLYLTDEQIARAQENKSLKIDDLIYLVFGNDFDFGTALKSLKRAHECAQGRGKDGSDAMYNLSKVKYSLGQIEKWSNENIPLDMTEIGEMVDGLISNIRLTSVNS